MALRIFLNSTLTSRGMCVLHTLDTLGRRLPCPSGVGVQTLPLRSKGLGSCDCSLDMVRSRPTGGGRNPEAASRHPSSAPPSASPAPSCMTAQRGCSAALCGRSWNRVVSSSVLLA